VTGLAHAATICESSSQVRAKASKSIIAPYINVKYLAVSRASTYHVTQSRPMQNNPVGVDSPNPDSLSYVMLLLP
jgi:hypothetical protein